MRHAFSDFAAVPFARWHIQAVRCTPVASARATVGELEFLLHPLFHASMLPPYAPVACQPCLPGIRRTGPQTGAGASYCRCAAVPLCRCASHNHGTKTRSMRKGDKPANKRISERPTR